MNYKVDVPELKAIMARKGVNIGALAKEMGYSRDTVSAVLHGKKPSYPVMCGFVDILEIDKKHAADIFFTRDLRNT